MKSVTLLAMMMLITGSLCAQALQDIKLNAPDMERGLTVMKAFEKRASATSFSSRELSLQDLSDTAFNSSDIDGVSVNTEAEPIHDPMEPDLLKKIMIV